MKTYAATKRHKVRDDIKEDAQDGTTRTSKQDRPQCAGETINQSSRAR